MKLTTYGHICIIEFLFHEVWIAVSVAMRSGPAKLPQEGGKRLSFTSNQNRDFAYFISYLWMVLRGNEIGKKNEIY